MCKYKTLGLLLLALCLIITDGHLLLQGYERVGLMSTVRSNYKISGIISRLMAPGRWVKALLKIHCKYYDLQ
jgi:hypothetical protein